MKNENILFESKVFSIHPNTMGFGSWLNDQNRYFRDEEVYVPLESVDEPPRPTSAGKIIYQFDPMETYFREVRLRDIRANKVNLAFARKVIVDEHYPESEEHWYDPVTVPSEWEGGPDEIIATQCLTFGRRCLLDMIAECRYTPAIPELREVMLHDDSFDMRRKALITMGTLDRKKTAPVVNEVLKEATNRYFIMEIIRYIRNYSPSSLFIPNLREKFEAYYHDYVKRALTRRYFGTIPQAILIYVCPRITTLESLEIIEMGLNHPYPHVEHNAIHALWWWLERVIKQKKVSEEIFKRVSEIRHKYDFGNQDAWDSFKKLPVAGPF